MKNKKLDIGLLKYIIRMDRKTLYDFLLKELTQYYPSIDHDGQSKDYMFCRGNQPIMLVAHLDTVFESFSTLYSYPSEDFDDWMMDDDDKVAQISSKEIFHDRVEQVMWSPEGLGADDRVGVFLILSIVRAGLRPSILFTTDEETGSTSGAIFATEYKDIFHEFGIKYLLQLDRAGYDDCVFYQGHNPHFEKYIESFSFVKSTGSFSDISIVSPILGVAGVNVSVGYFNEHSRTEMIDLFTMSKNYDIIYYMVEKSTKIKKVFKHIQKKKKVIPLRPIQTISQHESCTICSMPMKDYVYAKDYGKICLDCYTELDII